MADSIRAIVKGEVTAYLHHGDVCEALERFGREGLEFDLAYADPPYFLSSGGTTCSGGKRVSVDKGEWDKVGVGMGAEAAIKGVWEFNAQWMMRIREVLAPWGSLWVSGTRHNIFCVGMLMEMLRYRVLNDIVWEKAAPPPNLGCRCFTHGHEWLLWASMGKSKKYKHTFNYEKMKEEGGGKQMKSVWRIGAPRGGEKKFGKYPTQKPVELMRRILLACSNEGDWVLDLFCGSGSLGVAAMELERNYVGIDINSAGLNIAQKRME